MSTNALKVVSGMYLTLQFFVLVHLGCCNTINGVFYRSQKFNSHSSGGWYQHGCVLARTLSWAADCGLLTVSSHDREQREEASSLVYSCKSTKSYSWGLHPYVLI